MSYTRIYVAIQRRDRKRVQTPAHLMSMPIAHSALLLMLKWNANMSGLSRHAGRSWFNGNRDYNITTIEIYFSWRYQSNLKINIPLFLDDRYNNYNIAWPLWSIFIYIRKTFFTCFFFLNHGNGFSYMYEFNALYP